MTEETFGPVVGLMAVKDDDEAIALMNDSRYGLTASIWSSDADAAVADGRPRRDRHLVPEPLRLSRSGAGVDRRQGFRPRLSLSRLGFEALTRPKSFHLRLQP